jgi:outer membrane receptor protein involved in Fe transport
VGEPGVTTRLASVLDLGTAVPLPDLQSRQTGRVRALPNMTLDLELQNVFNLRYVENRASGFITPGLPRLFRVGLRVGTPSSGTLDGAAH